MKTMKKTVPALILVLALLLSLCVPAMADEKVYNNYVSLGDSIAAGNGRDDYKHGGTKFIEDAYPGMVKEALGAEGEFCLHGGMSGWRVYEMRRVLEKNLPSDEFTEKWVKEWGVNINKKMYDLYTNAIRNADLITIQFGGNELLGNMRWRVTEILRQLTADTGIKFETEAAIRQAEQMDSELEALESLLEYADTAEHAWLYAKLVANLAKSPFDGISEFTENWDKLMDDIYALNEDVDVVVLGMYNAAGSAIETNFPKFAALKKLCDAIGQPFVNPFNYEMQYSSKYRDRYVFVDLSGIDMTGSYDGCHPGDVGHQYICDKILEALGQFNRCAHKDTYTLLARNATRLTTGYTGDVYCRDCGALVAEGEVIQRVGSTREAAVWIASLYHTTSRWISRIGHK